MTIVYQQAPKPFKSFRKTNTKANRGVECEKAVQRALEAWRSASPRRREFNRLIDTKAAKRIVKSAPADFDFYDGDERVHGLIEAKQTEHQYRLQREKLPQLARLRKRAQCGGICLVIVYHSELKQFRCVDVEWLEANGDKGSWNLSQFDLFDSAEGALSGRLLG